MEEQIIEILDKSDKPLSVDELNDALCFRTVDEFKNLLKILNSLENSLKIYRTNKNRYMLFDDSHLRVGTMIGNKKGFGFVDIDGPDDVYIAADNLNGALHGDKVIVEITSGATEELEGRIVRVVERKFKEIVGEVILKYKKLVVKPDDDKIRVDILLDADDARNVVEGHKVVVKITNKISNSEYHGNLIKILGHKNDPGVDILSIASKYDINPEFSKEAIRELDDIPNEVSDEELIGRVDLRDKCIFTIDGADTKDIDDAVAVRKLDNGNYELGVHIADVSYYVKEGSHLDEDAYARGTSSYLADTVIPMLPHKLSNGICSLNPDETRLAMSCVMEIDGEGNVVNYDIFESVIKSRKKMTYKCVNSILEDNIVPEGYEPFESDLRLMAELASILRKNKIKRGYISFDVDEAKIIVDEEGRAIDVKLRERGVGENLIEDFMIAANETVASHIYYMELPFIYRVHGEPDEEKINEFLNFVSVLGYSVKANTNKITPTVIQDILDQLKGKKEFPILSSLLLRSMQKAYYDKNNIGHFGLASKCYTHFTSPIRRYPDTTVHRLLRKYLFKKEINQEVINSLESKLIVLGEHTSNREREAIECEREVDDMKMAEYMMNHIGEKGSGMISAVMPYGFFVMLPNLVEGLVKVESIKGDYYTYDEKTYSLIGAKNKRGYRLGDKVDIVVIAADKDAKTIDFELYNGDKDGDTQ